jgi:hypothetical protein
MATATEAMEMGIMKMISHLVCGNESQIFLSENENDIS